MQRRLDGFTLNELIGSGATGEVWRARPQAGGADVVLKWLAADEIDIEKLAASGLCEFRHPHVARLLDIRRDGSNVVLVHEFVSGVSLAGLLAERDRLSGSEVVTLLTPIAEALGAAHRAGLLHASLSPSAILVTPDGRPMVTDLGIWQSLRTDSAAASASTRLGYGDPEVARGGSPTPESDVFGVAAIGYHALTGRPPWSAGAGADNWERACEGSGVDLEPLLSGSGARLIDVIARGLSDRPSDRGAARDFAADVRDAAEPEPLHLSGPYIWPDLPSPVPAGQVGPDPAAGKGGSRALDITGEVRRGSSARHAAMTGTKRKRPDRASTVLGLGRGAPSRFGSAARLVPRRAVVSAGLALSLLAVLVLVLGGRSSEAGPDQAGLPGPATAPAADEVDERAVPDSPEEWAGLLTMLYQRRTLAFETGDSSLLDRVFTSDSPQLVTDRLELDRLSEAGVLLRGFAPEVLGVHDVSVSGDVATLQITDAFEPYETVLAADIHAAPLGEHPGRGSAMVVMTLVRTDDGWRIQTAARLA